MSIAGVESDGVQPRFYTRGHTGVVELRLLPSAILALK